jgi:Spy/CpxP family protein refolding chaperone
MKKITLFLCAVLLTVGAAVWAQPGHGWGPGRMGAHGDPAAHAAERLARLTQVLSLTTAQQAAAKQLQDKLQTTVQPLFTEAREKHEAIREALDSNNADAAEIGQLMIDAHKIGGQMRAAHDEFEKAFTALLTPEQAAKFKALQDKREARGPGRFGAPF